MSDFRQTAPAVPESVPALRHAVADYARELGATEEAVASLQLAVCEAMSNAVVHAFADLPEPGMITLIASPDGDDICVEVADDGGGMKPRPDSPGLGVGLPLMTSLTTSLEFRAANGGGTVVAMRFGAARTGAPTSAAP